MERQQTQAESAGGQLFKMMCEKLETVDEPLQFQKDLLAVCAQNGAGRAKAATLGKKLKAGCAWVEHIKKAGKENLFQTKSWFKNLSNACRYDGRDTPVFV